MLGVIRYENRFGGRLMSRVREIDLVFIVTQSSHLKCFCVQGDNPVSCV